MAWISVHESIDGPKLRSLYKLLGCSKFEAVGVLNYLWLWGLRNADKDGYVLYADEDDILRYLSGAAAGCDLDVGDIVNALIDTGWLEKNEGMPLRLHDWDVWQKEWYKYQNRLEADRKSKQRKRAEQAQKAAVQLPPEALSIQKEEFPEPEPAQKETKKQAKEYSTGFRDMWEVYPRKDDKAQAYEKYKARIKDGYSDGELLQAAQAYAAEMKKKRQPKEYILMAKRFFEVEGRFTEYLRKQPVVTTVETGNPFGRFMEDLNG